jgi:protein SCO1/2
MSRQPTAAMMTSQQPTAAMMTRQQLTAAMMTRQQPLAALRVRGQLCAIALLFSACARTQTEPLPTYGPLPEFALQDQRGQSVTQRDLRGQLLVVDFIFTSCPDVCPLLTEQLSALRKQLPEHAPIRLVSFSVDPEHDTPARLSQFATQHGAVRSDWWFLTGPLDQVKRVVTQGFKQAMDAQPTAAGQPANVLHGTHFVLVDAAGEIRGFYRSDPEGRQALSAAVATLLAEGKTS